MLNMTKLIYIMKVVSIIFISYDRFGAFGVKVGAIA